MISTSDLTSVTGSTVVDSDGDKIGTAREVYVDDSTGQPEWVTVNTGLFGTSESFIPLSQATLAEDGLRVPYDKKMVKDAPRLGDSGHLTPEEEDELYRYYGLSGGGTDTTAGTAGGEHLADSVSNVRHDDDSARNDDFASDRDTVGHDTSGPTTDDAMTRSEERLDVGTEQREAGRARLRKYVTTETETVQVPVTREEVRIEREPITEANRGDAVAGPGISEEEHEVTLHEERAVVNTETVPVERVRMETETVSDTETVAGEVRKEHIETEGDGTDRGTTERR